MKSKDDHLPLIWIDGATGTLGKAVLSNLRQRYRILTLCRRTPPEFWEFPVEIFPKDEHLRKETLSTWTRRHGVPIGLVSLSGANLNRLFLKTSRQHYEDLLQANFFHTVALVRELLPYFFSQEGGSVVVTSSLAAHHPKTGQSAYAASKGALDSWVRALAREVAPKQCRINAVAPGFIESPMLRELSGEQIREITDSIPLKRLGQPREVAGLIEFLLSEKSRYITGQIIPVTGGL